MTLQIPAIGIIIFNWLNMSMNTFEEKAGTILSVLGNPFRIQIAIALSGQEACVCHLEQLLDKRQAYISQHLMVMRDAGLLDTRRDGKYIYYRLADKEGILDLIRSAAIIAGFTADEMPALQIEQVLSQCICPNCEIDEKTKHSPQIRVDAVTN
jgi:ArsR family transcriptional regulator